MTTAFADSVKRAERLVDSGRALFREGLVPECHEYEVNALRLLLEAWGNLEPSAEFTSLETGNTETRALWALERASYRRTDRLRAAAAAIEPSSGAAGHEDSADRVWAEVEALLHFSKRKARTPRARRLARVRLGIAAGLVGCLALAFSVRLWGRPHIRASAVFSAAHPAAHAIDGLNATEWLLPDATAGWVDVMFHSPRTVHGVRLLNAHNVFYMDRAARKVSVTAFTNSGKAASKEGAFAELTQERSVLDLPLEGRDVTRIRVDVLTHFQNGGGLAEIEVY